MAEAEGVWPLLFQAEGADEVKGKAEGLMTVLNAFAAIGDKLAASLNIGFAGIQKSLQGVGKSSDDAKVKINEAANAAKNLAAANTTLGNAFSRASGFLMGWVRAGLSGTAEGNRLGIMMQLLSRDIASIFVPTIQKTIAAVQATFQAFRGLTGPQQAAIEKFALLTVGILGVATIMPRLIAGFELFKGVFVALTTVMRANPIVAIAEVLALLLLSSKQGRDSIMDLGKAMMPLFQAGTELLKPLVELFGELAKTTSDILVPAMRELAAIIRSIDTEDLKTFLKIAFPILGIASLFPRHERPPSANDPRRDLRQAASGFEGAEALYRRLTVAAGRVNYDQQTAQHTRTTAQNTERTVQGLTTVERTLRTLVFPWTAFLRD